MTLWSIRVSSIVLGLIAILLFSSTVLSSGNNVILTHGVKEPTYPPYCWVQPTPIIAIECVFSDVIGSGEPDVRSRILCLHESGKLSLLHLNVVTGGATWQDIALS